MTRVLTAAGEQKDALADFMPYIPRARAYPNVNQALGPGTVAIPLNSESYDTDGMHDPATNNTRLTIKTAGLYLITGRIDIQTNANAGRRTLYLQKNATVSTDIARQDVAGGSAAALKATALVECAVGDYFELMFASAVAGTDTITQGDGLSFLEAAYVGPGFNAVRAKPVIQYVSLAQFAALAPIDGDEVYLVVDSAAGVVWHLRYNANRGDAYKWERIAATPLTSYATPGTLVGTGWVNVGTSIVIPRTGYYIVRGTASIFKGAAGAGDYYYLSYYDGHNVGVAGEGQFSTRHYIEPISASYAHGQTMVFDSTPMLLTASDTGSLEMQASSADANAMRQWLSIEPVRIS